MDAVTAGLTIISTTYDAAAVLVAELDADLTVRYPGPDDPVIASAGQFVADARGAFFVALVDGAEAGCAGIRHETDSAAELKRMWVRPAYRGKGVARALLARCELAAAELGYDELWLETGTMQPEAVALYESAGYTPVPPFGQWAGAPLSITLGRRVR